MGAIIRFLILFLAVNAVAFDYVLQEDFTNDAPAPSATISGGTWVNSSTNMFVRHGKLHFLLADFAKWIHTAGTFARVNGRSLIGHIDVIPQDNNFGPYLAWTDSGQTFTTSPDWRTKSWLAVGHDSGSLNGSSGIKVSELNLSVVPGRKDSYQFVLVQRSTGGFIIGKGGSLGTNWSLIMVTVTNSSANSRVHVVPYLGNAMFDHAHVVDNIHSVFSTDYGLALSHVASPASGASATASSNVFVEVTWTPGSAQTLDLSFRRNADDREMIVRCNQEDSGVSLIMDNEGETELAFSNFTFTVGRPVRIWARAQDTNITVAVDGKRMFYMSSTFNNQAADVAVSGFTTAANFDAWPIDMSPYVPTNWNVTYKRALADGDSKSASAVVEGQYSLAANQNSPFWWRPYPERHAGAGWGVPFSNGLILTGRLDYYHALYGAPDAVRFNLGVNDWAGVYAGTTPTISNTVGGVAGYVTNFTGHLDSLHAKWPDAIVYIARPWRTGELYRAMIAYWNDTVIPEAIATRPWARLGLDERITLRDNGDYGFTLLDNEGLHPNTAGIIANAFPETRGWAYWEFNRNYARTGTGKARVTGFGL